MTGTFSAACCRLESKARRIQLRRGDPHCYLAPNLRCLRIALVQAALRIVTSSPICFCCANLLATELHTMLQRSVPIAVERLASIDTQLFHSRDQGGPF